MGQYHMIVNFTKKEFINPHKLGAGLKLWEQIATANSTGSALLLLLACSNGRGGGDLQDHPSEKVVGRWAGDIVIVVVDYAETEDVSTVDVSEFNQDYGEDGSAFTDISELVCEVLEDNLDITYEHNDYGWRKIVDKNTDEEQKHATSVDMLITDNTLHSNVRNR